MAEDAHPPAKRLARAGSFSGVWWKLGDPAGDPAAVERRLRAITDEEAAVKARIQSRRTGACRVRRGIAFASLAIEVLAFVHVYWTARRRRLLAGWSRKLLLLFVAPLLAVPASAAVVFAAFSRLQKLFDTRDEQRLRALVAERKSKIGQFRGSHHNMQKLLEVSTKYDPDGGVASATTSSNQPVLAATTAGRIKRSHSRLSFHIGDD